MTGCDKVSPGCDNCYAIREAINLQAVGDPHYRTDGNPLTSGPGFGYAEHIDMLGVPEHWLEERYVFVNSRSDVFHERATKEFVAEVFGVMAAVPLHEYVILTKRAGKMRSWLSSPQFEDMVAAAGERRGATSHIWPLPNLRVGVTIEDQHHSHRLAALVATPASIRYVEAEPLLGPVDFDADLLARVDQVTVGGEHGPRARPMDIDWVRSLRDQTNAAGAAFYFKQWGTGTPGRMLDGRIWQEWPKRVVV